MSKTQETERNEAVAELRKIVKPGDTLRTILRHRSQSGMSHSISVVKIGRDGSVRDLDYWLARADLGKFDQRWGGLKVGGCGMDMGFHLVYSLSATLYGSKHGYACLGDRCPSNSHVNDRDAPRGKGVRHHDGYAVSQAWL